MYAELRRKVCLQCKEVKSFDLFRYRKDRKDRPNGNWESYCKACEKMNFKKWYHLNKPELKLKDYKRNCEKFGLTVQEYERLVEKQNGKCAICNKPEASKRGGVIKKLAIDHCHQTGKNRSLLCNGCNTAIGLLKEDVAILESAIKYLNKFKK